MKFKIKLITSFLFSITLSLTSLFFNIIPCKEKNHIPGIDSLWDFCKISFNSSNQNFKEYLYFGFFKSPFLFLFLFFLFCFVIFLVILSILFKSENN